jgi:hypothetical protein
VPCKDAAAAHLWCWLQAQQHDLGCWAGVVDHLVVQLQQLAARNVGGGIQLANLQSNCKGAE